jgi:hypothetical protein
VKNQHVKYFDTDDNGRRGRYLVVEACPDTGNIFITANNVTISNVAVVELNQAQLNRLITQLTALKIDNAAVLWEEIK